MNALHDARPFVDLRKDAEEFRLKFEDDINRCLAHLDAKITALVCDPDSTGHRPSTGVRQNTLLEFAKMKYDIFVSISSQFNEMEREWLKYIAEMKKLFIENIEIFLAGTKLEVKFPTNAENKSRIRATEGAKSVASSIYPVFNSIAKTISAFGSPGPKNETEDESQKIVEPRTTDDKYLQKVGTPSHDNSANGLSELSIPEIVDLSDDEDDKNQVYESANNSLNRSMKSDQNYNKNTSNMMDEDEEMSEDLENITTVVTSRGKRGTGPGSVKKNESRLINVIPMVSSGRRLTRKLGKKAESHELDEAVEIPEEMELEEFAQEEENCNIPEETEKEEIIPPVQTKGQKGKKDGRRKKGTIASTISSENIEQPPDNAELNMPASGFLPLVKGRRGRKPGWRKTINQTIEPNALGDENAGNIEETEEDYIPPIEVKARKGRKSGLRKNINQTIDSEEKNMVEENASANGPESIPELKSRARPRGRPRAVEVPSMPALKSHPRPRGRPRAVVQVTKTAEEMTASEKDIAPALSEVITKNTETGDMDMYRDVESTDVRNAYAEDDEERDEFVAVAKSRYASQRKTLGPQDFPEFDDVPVSGRKGILKRKTYAGLLSEVSASPSKKLKTGGKKSLLPTKSKDDSSDNSLESGNFTEWVPLQSIDGTVPPAPGVYEVKVSRAKKSAYIGFSDSLRQKLTRHKLKENSGHKQLDKYLERNYNDILIRYEVMPSEAEAKSVAKDRVNTFVSVYNTTPAYN